MKNRKQFMLAAAVLMLLFSACKQENPLPPLNYPDYAMLKTGNYWIYERYTVDSNGNGSATGVYDSCFVEKDTVINGIKYARMMRPSVYSNTPQPMLLRDSLHYILNIHGDIEFSSQDFTSVFGYFVVTDNTDTLFEITKQMANRNVPFTVPAGTFTTSDFQTQYKMHPAYSGPEANRYLHVRYAQNIGIVSETMLFYSSNPNYTELRLVRYYVQ